MCKRACVRASCVHARASSSRYGHGAPRNARVASIFPDCTTTVVCGCVNRSQSKYICTHIRNAARRTPRLVMQSCARASRSFDILFAPRYAQSVVTNSAIRRDRSICRRRPEILTMVVRDRSRPPSVPQITVPNVPMRSSGRSARVPPYLSLLCFLRLYANHKR